jgi:ankyrin repeat protein
MEIKDKKNAEVLKILDDTGVDAADNFNRTALMNAALYNNLELVQELIKRKANLDLQDKIGYTALHFAAQEAHVDMVKMLLDNGANPNLADKHGNTASWVAYLNWKAGLNEPTIKLFAAHHADFTIKNAAGRSLLDIMHDELKQQLQIT